MTLVTLDIGPNLAQVLRYAIYAAIPAYLIVQWWIAGGLRSPRRPL